MVSAARVASTVHHQLMDTEAISEGEKSMAKLVYQSCSRAWHNIALNQRMKSNEKRLEQCAAGRST